MGKVPCAALVVCALLGMGCEAEEDGQAVTCVTKDDACTCTWDVPTYELPAAALAEQCGPSDESVCCTFVEDAWQPYGSDHSTCICKPLDAGQSCEPTRPWVRVPTCPPGYPPARDGSTFGKHGS